MPLLHGQVYVYLAIYSDRLDLVLEQCAQVREGAHVPGPVVADELVADQVLNRQVDVPVARARQGTNGGGKHAQVFGGQGIGHLVHGNQGCSETAAVEGRAPGDSESAGR